jgi:hypothetical protein
MVAEGSPFPVWKQPPTTVTHPNLCSPFSSRCQRFVKVLEEGFHLETGDIQRRSGRKETFLWEYRWARVHTETLLNEVSKLPSETRN